MIRINQIKLPINHTDKDIEKEIVKLLKLKNEKFTFKIVKQSIDARIDTVKYIYSVDVIVDKEKKIVSRVNNKNIMLTKEGGYVHPDEGSKHLDNRPVIIGSGPAGLFCAYMLSLKGYKPLVLERGEDVDNRITTVNKFFETGILNTESNVQFGEGGAGTFSDGKLNTMIKDKYFRTRLVLETFVKFGADKKILYMNKPHIGTDVLSGIVKNMRNEAIRNGAEFRFNTKLSQIYTKDGNIYSIDVENNGVIHNIPCSVLVLAIGHSSRDTFKMLYEANLHMESKAFAVGVRVEHPQQQININQYGKYSDKMPAADYKLVTNLPGSKRGVYSFCMCPGGYVVNSSSEPKQTVVNGMSYSRRDGVNANSAIIVTVTPKDFPDNSTLSGIEFQRLLEKAAYKEGEGAIPVQTYKDFKDNIQTTGFGEIFPQTKGEYKKSNLRNIFPEYISQALIEGIDFFSNKIKSYNRDDAILSGVESRTSSPVRIVRNDMFESNIGGLYPCGEGAGYAGGITSAAIDGIKIYEAIVKLYAPLTD